MKAAAAGYDDRCTAFPAAWTIFRVAVAPEDRGAESPRYINPEA